MNDLPDILARIIDHKWTELRRDRDLAPLDELRRRAADAPSPRDLAEALRRTPGGPVRVLAEIKRRSPSAGEIVHDFHPDRIAADYLHADADAISVLTDERFFGGSLGYIPVARRSAAHLPILRKDFIIDVYQVWQARAAGADAFLLIADALAADPLRDLVALGRDLGMHALVESHDADALDRAVASGAALIGINNRNLRTFNVDLATTERLAPSIPADRIIVAESGVAGPADVSRLLAAGAHAVLVGESLMRSPDKARMVADFKAVR